MILIIYFKNKIHMKTYKYVFLMSRVREGAVKRNPLIIFIIRVMIREIRSILFNLKRRGKWWNSNPMTNNKCDRISSIFISVKSDHRMVSRNYTKLYAILIEIYVKSIVDTNLVDTSSIFIKVDKNCAWSVRKRHFICIAERGVNWWISSD